MRCEMAYILWFILFITAFALIVNFFRSLIEFSKTEGVALTQITKKHLKRLAEQAMEG